MYGKQKMGKTIGIVFGMIQLLLGLMFTVSAASTGMTMRWVLGGVLVASGIAVMGIVTRKPKETVVRAQQTLTLRGEEMLQKLSCRRCGGELERSNVKILNGVVTVDCPYCHQMYEMTEELKW